MSIRVTFHCDVLAHGCGRHSLRPQGDGSTVEGAYLHALQKAAEKGWQHRALEQTSDLKGWVCPDCRIDLANRAGLRPGETTVFDDLINKGNDR